MMTVAAIFCISSIHAEHLVKLKSGNVLLNTSAGSVTKVTNKRISTAHTMFRTLSTEGPGSLDTAFGTGGVDTLDPMGYYSDGNAMALQSDGKIIIAGTSDNAAFNATQFFSVARFDSNGNVDKTFNKIGWAVAPVNGVGQFGNARAHAVAVQPDGKIVVAGYSFDQTNASAFGIARFNSNGTVDTTFGNSGSLRISISKLGGDFARSVVIQPDGKIIVTGRTTAMVNNGASEEYLFAAVRLTQGGQLDASFGNNGVATVLTSNDSISFEGYSAALQQDGKILIAGSGFYFEGNHEISLFAVARLDSNGRVDNTFGKNGISILNISGADSTGNQCNALALQKDGKILMAGYSSNALYSGGNTYPAIARLNADGSSDNSFGKGGSEIIPLNTFFNSTYINWSCNSVCLQSDDKIIVGGTNEGSSSQLTSVALCRLNQDGSLDDTFADSGWSTVGSILNNNVPAYFSIVGVKIAPDDKIIAGGTNYTRFTSDGEDAFNVARFLTGSSTTAVSAVHSLPSSFQLSQNYPNPFNPSTTINYNIARSGIVTLNVYNILGRLVKTLVNGFENSGKHKIVFNGDNYGLPSGVYFYRLKENNFIKTDKMVYLK